MNCIGLSCRLCLFLAAFLQACIVRALLRGSPEKVGIDLGTMLLHADARVSVDAARGSTSYFDSLTQQLGDDQETLMNPEASKVVSTANRLMLNTVETDDLCERAYSGACPDGWVITGNQCLAPSSYAGGCAHIFNPLGVTTKGKASFAKTCTAPWPCKDECEEGHDYYGTPCPIGWFISGSGVCQRTAESGSVHSACSSAYYFSGMDIPQRQQITYLCALKWACRSRCAMDFSGVCPAGWSNAGGICVAPLTYAGSCSHGINITDMTDVQLQAFSDRCLAPFPCKNKED